MTDNRLTDEDFFTQSREALAESFKKHRENQEVTKLLNQKRKKDKLKIRGGVKRDESIKLDTVKGGATFGDPRGSVGSLSIDAQVEKDRGNKKFYDRSGRNLNIQYDKSFGSHGGASAYYTKDKRGDTIYGGDIHLSWVNGGLVNGGPSGATLPNRGIKKKVPIS